MIGSYGRNPGLDRVSPDLGSRLEQALDLARAFGEGIRRGREFARLEEEARRSPCGIHVFPAHVHHVACPICAREIARIRAGAYDRISETDPGA